MKQRQLSFDLNVVCPTCKRPFPPDFIVSGTVRKTIVAIIAHRPDGIDTETLHQLVYAADPNGGPSLKTISVIINNANKQLRPQGYEIHSPLRGRGARYFLRKLDGHPKCEPAGTENAAGLEGTQSAGTPRQH